MQVFDRLSMYRGKAQIFIMPWVGYQILYLNRVGVDYPIFCKPCINECNSLGRDLRGSLLEVFNVASIVRELLSCHLRNLPASTYAGEKNTEVY